VGLGLVAASVSVVGGLTACTAAPNPEPSPVSVVGLTLLDARPELPDAIKIYDLSTPVLDLPPMYNDGQPQGQWTVVAQCPEIDAGAVGVIPTTEYAGDVRAQAEGGELNAMLSECGSD